MKDVTCPACEDPVAAAHRVGPVTYVPEPCGHQVDDHVYRDLTTDADR